MNIIVEVKANHCFIVDDIVDSGVTLCNAALALIDNGASAVTAYITHGGLSGEAVNRLQASVLKELVITDSINNQNKTRLLTSKKLRILSIDELMAEAIARISEERSVSSLFDLNLQRFLEKTSFLFFCYYISPSTKF